MFFFTLMSKARVPIVAPLPEGPKLKFNSLQASEASKYTDKREKERTKNDKINTWPKCGRV